ncbi:transcriptional antiterminator, BglG family [Clostridium amylolyticum]|uniref:Transcriptional antiterminator, BglG family n=1 Tax=Clostridium amylolyticum TaxID=1121298 RepID=A0A1M6MZY6_9CLOT|nr:BglG family transcription antiterminator [Clostridium amylolyticum]SHJ88913.1 transcriptional antiterminator, BglG family [Clostridium amylolyticum]
MVCLNSRQIDIIEWLIKEFTPVSIKEMALSYEVSSRTIRYDLELIENWLSENKATLVKVPKKGIELKSICERDVLLEKLKFLSVENRVLSDKERIKYVVLELLMSDIPLTIENISNKIFLSKNTIMKTLKDINVYLSRYKLELSKSTKGGFYIKGSEKKIRKLQLSIFLDVLDSNNILKILRETIEYEDISDLILNYNNFIEIDDMKRFSEHLILIQDKYNYFFTDVDFIKLIFYIAIMVKRFYKGKKIENTSNLLKDTIEYNMSKDLINRIFESNAVNCEDGEINELAKYIIESKSFNTINELKELSVEEVADKKTIEITQRLIGYVEEKINVDIKDDTQLFNGLVLHLKSAVARVQNNSQINNIYTDYIKVNFPFVYQVVEEAIRKMPDIFGVDVSDDEIAYIALHIHAAYERISEKSSRYTALLICPEGISFLSILSTRIKREIHNLNLIETCSVYDYKQFKNNIDFVISTIPLSIEETDVVTVSHFMTNDDIYKIKQTILQLNKFRFIYKFSYDNIERKMLMLKDILKKESIKLQVEADNWEEAVRKAGDILVNENKVKDLYVENMIQAIKDLGPYIVIMPGIAFAHARPDETVNETCMSMITLKKPIEFGSKQNDPVSIVFAFGANSQGEHLKALQDLAKFLSVEKNFQMLINTKDINEIYNRIIN